MLMWRLNANPAPRPTPEPYRTIEWDVIERRPLPASDGESLGHMAGALDARMTERVFGPVSDGAMGALFWHAARTKQTAISQFGAQIERRPAPSAGAIHPIHLVIHLNGCGRWARYNPQEHSLEVLRHGEVRLRPLANSCDELVPRGSGNLIAFVAEPGRTASKYENAESLVWRDAGILQGHLALVAASLGINYCLLGITGNPWITDLSDKGELQGVGVAIFGARP